METACLYTFIGWLLGGFVGGATGLGGMMISLPFLLMAMPPQDAVLVCCLAGAPGVIQTAWLYRKHVVWGDVRWLWASCVPGIVAGALTLKFVPVQYLQIMISIMIAVFVVLKLFEGRKARVLGDSVLALIIAGFASGFANSSTSVVGVPIGIFVLLRNLEKDRARSTLSMFFVMSGWVTVATQAAFGMYRLDLFIMAAAGLAGILIGNRIGYGAGRHMNQKFFVRFVLCFLSVSAAVLFVKAI